MLPILGANRCCNSGSMHATELARPHLLQSACLRQNMCQPILARAHHFASSHSLFNSAMPRTSRLLQAMPKATSADAEPTISSPAAQCEKLLKCWAQQQH